MHKNMFLRAKNKARIKGKNVNWIKKEFKLSTITKWILCYERDISFNLV